MQKLCSLQRRDNVAYEVRLIVTNEKIAVCYNEEIMYLWGTCS